MIPALAPNQDATCGLCGAKQSYMPGHEGHHWIPRSLGGTETILLCVRCHNATEGSQPWKVGVTPDYVFALDHEDHVIVKRWRAPEGWDQAAVLATIDNGTEALAALASQFRYLDQDGVEQVAEAIGRLSRVVHWRLVGELIEQVHLSSPYGSKSEAIAAVVTALGLKDVRSAYYYREALHAFEEHSALVKPIQNLVGPGHMLVLAKAKKIGMDTTKAAELLADRLTAGNYSVADFRAELESGKTSDDAPPLGERASIVRYLREVWSRYPEDIWPDPPAGEHGKEVDTCSARSIRWILSKVATEIERGEHRKES